MRKSSKILKLFTKRTPQIPLQCTYDSLDQSLILYQIHNDSLLMSHSQTVDDNSIDNFFHLFHYIINVTVTVLINIL